MFKKIVIGIIVLILLCVGYVVAKMAFLSMSGYKTKDYIDTTDQAFYDSLDKTNDVIISENLRRNDFINVLQKDKVFGMLEKGEPSFITTKTKLKEIIDGSEKEEKIIKEIETKNGIENISFEEFDKIKSDFCIDMCFIVATDKKTLLVVEFPK